ncbi:MAG: ATP-binding domain-containing protein [Bacteroidales bacterium]|nr:ATP-binding domain-containing protein [Bacteroidales bacterium]
MAEVEDFYIDYSKLDDFQRQLIDRKNNKSMVVKGSAGSGKSLIALHKAKQLAALGSYVIVVYTKSLRQYFEDGLKQLELSNVFHYHSWIKNKRHVKYMIVDECQDFSHEQIEELKSYGELKFFFGDTAQSIMAFKGVQSVEDTARSLGVESERLYFNYRLTKGVAQLAEKVGRGEDLVLQCVRDGEKTHLIDAATYDKQLDKIIETIKNKQLTNVGILLPHNTQMSGASRNASHLSVEYVKDYFQKKGMTYEFKYNANESTAMDLDFHSKNPKIMTYWCAKGLQFKDVFVPGCEYAFPEEKRAAIYVAITRCSERLYLGFSGSLCNLFPQKSDSVYESEFNVDDLEF